MGFGHYKGNQIMIITNKSNDDLLRNILNRCQFYIPDYHYKILYLAQNENIQVKYLFNTIPLLLLTKRNIKNNLLGKLRGGIFDVDYQKNPGDGREWHSLLNYTQSEETHYNSKNRFVKYCDSLNKYKFSKCYIFSTGPSLNKALSHDWSDGYRVVCNTIVRDQNIWNHINPHFIVAGDAIYHFGHTKFAKKFREDLSKRLQENNTMFVYPSVFHNVVKRDFSHLKNKLIPVPLGEHQYFNNLTNYFKLPDLGNVLNLLLLPLACTLSKNIFMWGFDGRAPDDKLFWSYSKKHFYDEYFIELQEAHPAFYKYHVPKDNPEKYVKSVHGDILDSNMNYAENRGWQFNMMHTSWTPALQKRYNNNY